MSKRRDMKREGVRELDREMGAVGCRNGEIWREGVKKLDREIGAA